MLIRIRDGWDGLSAYLRGEDIGEKRQRFKIWVCTAAERAYALEAWRLLDPTEELISREEVKKRLICAGKQKKSLFRTFNLGPLHDTPFPDTMLCPKRKLGPLNEGHSEMAMAIIADDRIDVWEKRNQDQILKIEPYQYPCTKQDSSEIQRMLSVFQSARSQFYFELMEHIGPTVREIIQSGIHSEALQKLQEQMQRVVSIGPFLTPLTTPPQTVSVTEPPIAFDEVSLKPNDRRVIAVPQTVRQEPERVNKRALPPRKRKNSKMARRPNQNRFMSPSLPQIASDPPRTIEAIIEDPIQVELNHTSEGKLPPEDRIKDSLGENMDLPFSSPQSIPMEVDSEQQTDGAVDIGEDMKLESFVKLDPDPIPTSAVSESFAVSAPFSEPLNPPNQPLWTQSSILNVSQVAATPLRPIFQQDLRTLQSFPLQSKLNFPPLILNANVVFRYPRKKADGSTASIDGEFATVFCKHEF